jgi:prepilin-type N-terminal cleavage/methylation domain-containing protein
VNHRVRATRGYTLIELLLVMVALGLLATVVYVSWEAILPRTKLNTAVRELAATLQETRSDAVSRGIAFTVEYYFEEEETHPRGYRVVTPFRAGGAGGLAADNEERLALGWKRLPENIEFQSITINGILFTKGRCEVRFDARGSASDHTIVLVQRPFGNTYTVEVQALTGFIQMQPGEFVRNAPKDSDFE